MRDVNFDDDVVDTADVVGPSEAVVGINRFGWESQERER